MTRKDPKVATLTASNLRTAATQTLHARFLEHVQSSTTFPADSDAFARGEIAMRDGRVYSIEVRLVRGDEEE